MANPKNRVGISEKDPLVDVIMVAFLRSAFFFTAVINSNCPFD